MRRRGVAQSVPIVSPRVVEIVVVRRCGIVITFEIARREVRRGDLKVWLLRKVSSARIDVPDRAKSVDLRIRGVGAAIIKPDERLSAVWFGRNQRFASWRGLRQDAIEAGGAGGFGN